RAVPASNPKQTAIAVTDIALRIGLALSVNLACYQG
ncbi:MAG: hypothetical protein JWR10_1286, partial [Rubritepida sp.]|nr:hypothetical protein [Rubritepida sp.]